jgi:hypothetical protein
MRSVRKSIAFCFLIVMKVLGEISFTSYKDFSEGTSKLTIHIAECYKQIVFFFILHARVPITVW